MLRSARMASSVVLRGRGGIGIERRLRAVRVDAVCPQCKLRILHRLELLFKRILQVSKVI
jgi:hypothetical protein